LTRTNEAETVLRLVDPASSDYGSGTFVPPSEA
jgi:hypothetical protein